MQSCEAGVRSGSAAQVGHVRYGKSLMVCLVHSTATLRTLRNVMPRIVTSHTLRRRAKKNT